MKRKSTYTKNYNLKIAKNFYADKSLLDKWLSKVLLVIPQEKDIHIDSNISFFAWRLLVVNNTLLQAINIPIFEIGKLVEIQELSNEYNIKFNIPYINNINEKIYMDVFNISVKSLINFMQKTINEENIFSLFDYFQTNLIPLSKFTGSGKSTLPILKEAFKKKIAFRHINFGIYQLGEGANSRFLNRSLIDTDSVIGTQIAQNKVATAMLLKDAGLPAAEHIQVSNSNDAINAAEKLNYPLVVKPVDLDRGEGVCIDIYEKEQLLNSFEIAYKLSPRKQVLVEKQVEGVCHRVFITKGSMLYAVKRLAKSIKGDGVQTIKALILEANKKEAYLPPWKREQNYPMDEEALKTLQNLGYSFESVVQKDTFIPLRKIESTQFGGRDEDVTKIIHQENIELAVRAAKLFKLEVVGVDIISVDISIPWYKNGAIINEVNHSPLLGGGDISKKTISKYLDIFIKENGKIPIINLPAEYTLEEAKELQKKHIKKGEKCFLTSKDMTITHHLKERFFSTNILEKRVEALLLDTEVDVLIILNN